jgi:glycogen(starch) synthase
VFQETTATTTGGVTGANLAVRILSAVRVLTVGNLYPPHHFGGYEQVWQSAVGHLRDQGHQARVLATRYRHPGTADGDEPDVFRELEWYWRDHDFKRVLHFRRPLIEHRNLRRLARHIDELQPDVVSFWSMGGMSHSLIEDVRRRGIPMVAFVHDHWLDYGRFTDQWMRLFRPRRQGKAAPLARLVTRLPTSVDYGSAGRYVFVSEFIRQRAVDLSLDLPDTAVAHSGINPAFLDGGPPEEHDWRWRLLHVGRLHPDKGIEDAVRALTHLPGDATLTFAGTWDERDEHSLARLVADLGLDARVTMLGQRPASEVAELYRTHDALLFPVRWDEPWGLVPIEAMASGLPVIATGRGGSGEYLRDGENSLIVPAEDPRALAAAVRRLAGDPELRRRLRSGGLQTAPRHTEPIFNAAVERHLLDVAP